MLPLRIHDLNDLSRQYAFLNLTESVMVIFLVAILSHVSWAFIQEAEPILPSSNYFNIMQEMIAFKKFAMKIGVSPLQIAEIQKNSLL